MSKFVITGGFITEHARALWRELSPEKALSWLQSVDGLSREQRLAICEGTKQLTGDSNTGIEVEDDNDPGLTLHDVFVQLGRRLAVLEQENSDLRRLLNDDVEYVGSPEGQLAIPRGSKGRPGSVAVRPDVLEEVQRRRRVDEDEEDEVLPPPPKPVYEITTDTGWLSPQGEYYSCGYGQHRYIAELLDSTQDKFDDEGWVKVCVWNGDQQFFCKEHDKLTAAQIKMVRAYCEKREIELPFWFTDLAIEKKRRKK